MSELEIQQDPLPSPNRKAAPKELAYRLRQQRIAADFGYFALKTEDLDELLQEATRLAAEGLDASFAKYLRHLGDGSGFLVAAGVGWGPGVVGRARVGDEMESPAGYAFHTEKAVISNHLSSEERFRTPALLIEHGIKRALNVIIRSEERRYGVLEVDTPGEGQFDEADVAFLESFASMLGVAIQRGEREARLREAIRHQEVLTLEASHRVKNSLSIVASLLSMQARATGTGEAAEALQDAVQRVQTVASLHDRLWRSKAVLTVDLDKFLHELCEQVMAASSGVRVTCRVDSVTVITEQAVNVGLLVNELTTNAIKYAFDEGATGTIEVTVAALGDGTLLLFVDDDGKGLPADFDPSTASSLGVRLITSISRQLGGDPKWERLSQGTRFALEFPLASRP
ncbi:GAF domain-containing protein [Rhizobium laguerreae]|uniref:sensor histidine kinase n=1 Tax=Rhizobium laguerreae TaxID=1076926 RepID=UPI001C910456|nr:histidine kinase dimerization/phosphoacceptor domain -containing protein [Rhizobium laguerreae]MBY3088595.1 GAF domain-containing protein [Rhizobium laguerreae]MBY3150659.1 GAF domain-containing protein [Rhizobium laguerreae]